MVALVAQSVAGQRDEIDLGYVPENDGSYTAQLFALAEPFYVAADYAPCGIPSIDGL